MAIMFTSRSHQMLRPHHRIIYLLLLALITLVNCESDQSDLNDDESINSQVSSPLRSPERRSASRSRVVTGTFRFRRVLNGDEASRKPVSSRGAGWDIEGCYCETGSHCSCNGNRNRVRMFVRTGSKRPPMPGMGMGFPMPPPGMFGGDGGGGGGGGGDDLGPVDGPEGPISPAGLETMEGETSGRLRRQRSGCFCNNNGCSGSDCATMNGCVCSQGACWGSACDSRIPTNPSAGQQAPIMASGNLMAAGAVTPQLTNPLQLVRNALFAASPVVSVNGQPANNQQMQQQQQQSGQLQSANAAAVTIGDCSCSNQGCTGSGCANMNGCFCVGSNCWGNACNINSIMQASGNLLSNANALRVANQATNQAVLSNLAGRLAGQLSLPNGQTGQTSGNLLDIPGLTGAGGILSGLLPGGFGGGDVASLNPFGGGGGGGGGGYPQGMQVVQGVPVKRLTASRARRIRGKGVRGKPGMELAATRGRVRPAHVVRKKIVPVEASDESSQSLSVVPSQRIDPVLGLIELDRDNPVNSSHMMPQDQTSDQGYQESLNNGQESLDVFTLTDEWLNEMTQGQST